MSRRIFTDSLRPGYRSRRKHLNADKHSPASSVRSTKRRVRGCLCQWELKAPTDRSRSDCVHEQVAKRIANVRFTSSRSSDSNSCPEHFPRIVFQNTFPEHFPRIHHRIHHRKIVIFLHKISPDMVYCNYYCAFRNT